MSYGGMYNTDFETTLNIQELTPKTRHECKNEGAVVNNWYGNFMELNGGIIVENKYFGKSSIIETCECLSRCVREVGDFNNYRTYRTLDNDYIRTFFCVAKGGKNHHPRPYYDSPNIIDKITGLGKEHTVYSKYLLAEMYIDDTLALYVHVYITSKSEERLAKLASDLDVLKEYLDYLRDYYKAVNASSVMKLLDDGGGRLSIAAQLCNAVQKGNTGYIITRCYKSGVYLKFRAFYEDEESESIVDEIPKAHQMLLDSMGAVVVRNGGLKTTDYVILQKEGKCLVVCIDYNLTATLLKDLYPFENGLMYELMSLMDIHSQEEQV